MFGTMLDYWHMTGDSSYNDVTMQALLHQAGRSGDFMPANQTLTEGNDDQGFWALAAMTAAEIKFPNPPADKPQWLSIAQAVFNQYVDRWDESKCEGGLRWQIYPTNAGYNYTNTIANGCFLNLAARLSRYTGNSTYADWAAKVYDWEDSTGLITDEFLIYDGAAVFLNNTCGDMDKTQWSYNAGLHMHGTAVMYNITGEDKWKARLDGIIKKAQKLFVSEGVVYEQFCEPRQFCNLNQVTFKGYLLRWLAATTQMAPYTAKTIEPIIRTTAEAAAAACIGPVSDNFKGLPDTACGFAWIPKGKYDGLPGVGPQMDALSAIMYTLTPKVPAPVTAKTGGTSTGNPGGGKTDSEKKREKERRTRPTIAGKVGAGFITMILIGSIVGSTIFLLM